MSQIRNRVPYEDSTLAFRMFWLVHVFQKDSHLADEVSLHLAPRSGSTVLEQVLGLLPVQKELLMSSQIEVLLQTKLKSHPMRAIRQAAGKAELFVTCHSADFMPCEHAPVCSFVQVAVYGQL